MSQNPITPLSLGEQKLRQSIDDIFFDTVRRLIELSHVGLEQILQPPYPLASWASMRSLRPLSPPWPDFVSPPCATSAPAVLASPIPPLSASTCSTTWVPIFSSS